MVEEDFLKVTVNCKASSLAHTNLAPLAFLGIGDLGLIKLC